MKLAAYQPDIPQNTGALIRLCAALGVDLELIEPFGFIWDERKIRTAAMDYLELVKITRHRDWDNFTQATRETPQKVRIVLLSTKAETDYRNFIFADNDILLLGRESAGVPDEIHAAIPHRVKIPMAGAARSLNIAMAGAIILSEALRQIRENKPDYS